MIWKPLFLSDLALCVFSFSPALAFRLKAEFRPFVERTAIGETSIRHD
jgi:hypothetical protein